MNIAPLSFGQWLPDLADLQNPGLTVADNVVPTADGFDPFYGAAETSAATTEPVQGARTFFDGSSNAVTVMGSSTRLATKRALVVSESTGYTAVADAWRFDRFGDLIVAVSRENDPQYLTDVGTVDAWVDLPGNPPKAAQVGRVGDFLVLGDLIDIDGLSNPDMPHRVRWSAFNNPTADWVTDRGENSDYRDLDPRYGRVTAIVGGRYGLVFQERAVWRMVFVGAPKVFEFQEVLTGRGCVASDSAVTIGAFTYFQSQNGILRTDGSSYDNVSSSRVAQWLSDNMSDTSRRLTHGAVNWPRRSIFWAFKTGAKEGFDRILIYNFVEDKWATATIDIDHLVQHTVDAETISSLGLSYSTLAEATGLTVGEEAFRSRGLSFAAFVRSGAGSAFATLNGPALQAEMVTGDFRAEGGKRATVTGLWPEVETQAADVQCQTRTRSQHGGNITVTNLSSRAADGFCPQHVDGWLHSFRMIVPAGASWAKATGLLVRFARSGSR